MRITSYRLELDGDLHNVLVKEKSCNYPADQIRNPAAIAGMLNSVFRLNVQAEEHMYMIAVNTKCRPLGVFEVSHGTVNQCICEPREIFVKALLCGASGVILAHNHPSGDCVPSQQDIDSHNRVKEAGKIIGIRLLDSIIVGGGSYYSFEENKL